MDNTELLEKIRLERPHQTINKVISFKKNIFGFYDVTVEMQGSFVESKIIHYVTVLPYPLSEYLKLTTPHGNAWNLKITS
jgi:hypothetical protein